MNNSPYKNLINNSIVFTIANIGSKIISFIMVPLYTYVLSTEEYGTVDVMLTLNSLLLPVLFLSISDAVLRYALDKRYDKSEVLSAAIKVCTISILIICIILPVIGYFESELKEYLLLFGILFVCNGIMQTMNQFLRATDHVKAYAFNGILYTFVFAGLNIIMLVTFKLGVTGYLLSTVIADAVCIVFAASISKCWRYISLNKNVDEMLRVMLRYSIPLIPNALMWWIMDASDKFVIALFLGFGANGLYAVAKKLPTLIDTFHGIFNQAWQISAIQENDNEYTVIFTTRVYRHYLVFLNLIAVFIMAASKPLVMLFLNKTYYESWSYIPMLLVSVVFSSLSGFLSSKLIASEQTVTIFRTTLIGAIINTAMNFALIPFMGINGAGLATLVSFFIVWKIRERLLVRRGSILKVNTLAMIIMVFVEIAFYYVPSILVSEILMLGGLTVMTYHARATLVELALPIIRKCKTIVSKMRGGESEVQDD